MCDNFLDLIFELEEGNYSNNDGLEIEIFDNKESKTSQAFIKNDGILYVITNIGNIEKNIRIQVDELSYFMLKESSDKTKHKDFFVVENDRQYHLCENGISVDCEDIYLKKGLTLIKKINEKCYLSYCYQNNTLYVHYKENKTLNTEEFLSDDLFVHVKVLNNVQLNKLIKEVKESFNGENFNEVSRFLLFPELDYEMYQEIIKIIEVSDVYIRYQDNLYLELYENDINNISLFVKELLKNKVKTKIKNNKNNK